MSDHIEQGEEPSSWCSVCGGDGGFAILPGGFGKTCLECSTDINLADLLVLEIDEGTFAGRDTNDMVSELAEISSRMLNRAQTAGRRV
jgi:hypothetical protein